MRRYLEVICDLIERSQPIAIELTLELLLPHPFDIILLLDCRIAIKKKEIIMTVEQAILENVKVLSPDQQQEVLAFIKFLQSDKGEHIYKGRFKELQQEIRLGMDAAERGEVIDAEDRFRSLRLKLQR
ncbi:hypothetical protein QUB70_15710 [Microcoleus sp. A003_D6]|uniref:hypothetical protein n=1 Tax=Microcoleus sp. A003_D6 TaxID=3055266 RepID=UPI002FD6ACE3